MFLIDGNFKVRMSKIINPQVTYWQLKAVLPSLWVWCQSYKPLRTLIVLTVEVVAMLLQRYRSARWSRTNPTNITSLSTLWPFFLVYVCFVYDLVFHGMWDVFIPDSNLLFCDSCHCLKAITSNIFRNNEVIEWKLLRIFIFNLNKPRKLTRHHHWIEFFFKGWTDFNSVSPLAFFQPIIAGKCRRCHIKP